MAVEFEKKNADEKKQITSDWKFKLPKLSVSCTSEAASQYHKTDLMKECIMSASLNVKAKKE